MVRHIGEEIPQRSGRGGEEIPQRGAKYIALWDTRLNGGVGAKPNILLIQTNQGVALGTAFPQIRNYAGGGKVEAMFILCHGYAGSSDVRRQSGDFGGMGLQLGTEDVTHANASMFEAIKNKVKNIIIYACGAGDTQAGAEGTTADGRYLMGAIAIHTNAHVFAADRIQWYNTDGAGNFNFGNWEGSVLYFPPSGQPPSVVGGPPVELTDV